MHSGHFICAALTVIAALAVALPPSDKKDTSETPLLDDEAHSGRFIGINGADLAALAAGVGGAGNKREGDETDIDIDVSV
ncbi:hypothetical protein NLG97_g1268 [Lecanicillium saksenae]|uniref:Uncharacterized protein n=1 Tax=Lecanicillium saksenae TaxID=468837 RepID=A0ACC1R7M8_9HYPO|nr:hypothetical protein NLG97_g1268 [Lecanicillium saksenae]